MMLQMKLVGTSVLFCSTKLYLSNCKCSWVVFEINFNFIPAASFIFYSSQNGLTLYKVAHPFKIFQRTKFYGPTFTAVLRPPQKFERLPFYNGEVYVTVNGMTFLLNVVKFYQLFQKLLIDTHRRTYRMVIS
jgi:hypothetical protein